MGARVPSELLIGHRLAADQAFAQQLTASRFTSSEWDLIMSIVEFEIDRPSDPGNAHLEAVTEELPRAIDATAELPAEPGIGPEMAGGGQGIGIVDRIASALNLGDVGADREERVQSAEMLIEEYTAVLEGQLKGRDAWEDLCEQLA